MKNLTLLSVLAICCLTLPSCNSESVNSGDASDQVANSNASMRDQITQARSLRELIMSDPHRPAYHFVSPEGRAYPFDPQAAIYLNGKYHLGFVYQTFQNGELEHFWGHIVSTDLFNWTLLPDMLDVKKDLKVRNT